MNINSPIALIALIYYATLSGKESSTPRSIMSSIMLYIVLIYVTLRGVLAVRLLIDGGSKDIT